MKPVDSQQPAELLGPLPRIVKACMTTARPDFTVRGMLSCRRWRSAQERCNRSPERCYLSGPKRCSSGPIPHRARCWFLRCVLTVTWHPLGSGGQPPVATDEAARILDLGVSSLGRALTLSTPCILCVGGPRSTAVHTDGGTGEARLAGERSWRRPETVAGVGMRHTICGMGSDDEGSTDPWEPYRPRSGRRGRSLRAAGGGVAVVVSEQTPKPDWVHLTARASRVGAGIGPGTRSGPGNQFPPVGTGVSAGYGAPVLLGGGAHAALPGELRPQESERYGVVAGRSVPLLIPGGVATLERRARPRGRVAQHMRRWLSR